MKLAKKISGCFIMFVGIIFLSISLSGVGTAQDNAVLPEDAQSTTGPVPPVDMAPGISITALDYEVTISGVPAYLWYRGCGPTAAGMVVGYYDGLGFPDLVAGSAATQTTAVDNMISSSGNYNDYCLPIDSYPTLLSDLSEPPPGDEHTDNCVADLMETSQSYVGNYYGWSWYSKMDDAIRNYAPMAHPRYVATTQNITMASFTWANYQAEIDANRPVVFLVDTNSDGSTDHFITAIGYGEETGTGNLMYACLNTWDALVYWYEFAQIAPGQSWGIYGVTTTNMATMNAVGVYRGRWWYVDSNGNQQWDVGTDDSFVFGVSTDIPVMGDWNGDGVDEAGLFRNAYWYLDVSGDGQWGVGDVSFKFGQSTDTPVVGDWNGDGIDDVGVYRNRWWYLDSNGDRAWNSSQDVYFRFGQSTDIPIAGDWNGDDIDEVGVFRDRWWYLDTNGNRQWNAGVDAAFKYGQATDIPVVGDWQGDGVDEVGVFRSRWWYLDSNGNDQWDVGVDAAFKFGLATDTPVSCK